MVRSTGLINRLRDIGRTLLPKSRVRTFANSVLLAFERRKGSDYVIAGTRLRFLPGSEPHVGGPRSSLHMQLDAIQLDEFAKAVRAGAVVADVGAYRGVYSMVAAARAGGGGHVIAFEPSAGNIEFIGRNLALNQLSDRVTILPIAVAAEAGSATFYASGGSSANSLFRTAIEPHADGTIAESKVRTSTLDAEFERFGRLPSVVKIDVEGAEFAVLRGAEKILRSDAVIFCELHPHAWKEAGYTGEELVTWLRERGRELRALDSDAPVTTLAYGPVRLVQSRS